jgi:hypothetical protein
MFAIVENKEQLPFADSPSESFRVDIATPSKAEYPRDRGENQVRCRERDQFDPPSITFEIREQASRKLLSELGLSDPAKSSQSDDAMGQEQVP